MFGDEVSQKPTSVHQPLLQYFTVYIPYNAELAARESESSPSS